MKVLIVDDTALFHQILMDVFDNTNITPVICESIEQGLQCLAKQAIDFVCVSMYLPDGNGISFCKTVRTMPMYQRVPIILFTSDETEAIYKNALSAGLTEVFHKRDVQQLVNFINRFTLQQQPFHGRVLYIEDTFSQQKMVTKVFESKGLEVDAFESGEEAWKAYLQKDYDLVVTDVVLEGSMTGMALTNHIRRLDSEKGDVPILAITGFDDISRRIELFYLGVTDYVIKPIIEEELIARVRNLIKSKQFFTEAVEQRHLAEQADIAKSEFLANMSHELRTPMHGIISFAKFGLDKCSDAPREKLKTYFAHIDTSAQRLLVLLNDLLDLAKLESGKMLMNITSYDFPTLINESIAEQQAWLKQRNITIKVKVEEGIGIVALDVARIMQVIANLLSNAIKFSPENGIIYIQVVSSTLGEEKTPAIRFSMKDKGEGIHSDHLESVFDKFVQSSEAATAVKGTGLGLAICKEIIEGHKGKIWAENSPSGGACFYFLIPLRNGHELS